MGKTRSRFLTFLVVFSMLMSMGVSFGADLSSNVFSASEIYFHGDDFVIEGSTNSLSTIPAFWFDHSGDLLVAFSIHHTKNPSQVELNGMSADGYETFSTSDSAIRVNSNTFLADNYTSDSSPHKWLVADFGEVSIEDLKEQFSLYVNLGAGGHNIGDNGSISIIIIGEELEISNYTGVYDGAAHSIEVTNIITGDTVSYSDDGGVTWTTTNPTFAEVGKYTVDVKVENADYEDRVGVGTVTITKRDVTLTSATDNKTYDGTALENDTVTESGDGFVTGEGATWEVTGSQTEVGNSENTFTYTLDEGTSLGNYNIDKVEGILTVTSATGSELSITNYNDKYDGQAHSIDVTNLALEDTIEYSEDGGDNWSTTNPSYTDVGVYTVDVKVTRTGYEDRTDIGTVTITKRDLTLTSATDSKTYDGTALENDTATESGDGFVTGEGATWDVTGSQTEVGNSENTFTYTLDDGTSLGNYNISKVEGTLKVTPVNLTITADNKSKIYGESDPELTATISGFVDGEDLADLQGQINFDREVGEALGIYDITPSGVSSNNYKITFEKGQLTITSADSIKLEVNGYEDVYDGKYHSISVTNESDFDSLEFSTDNETWSESLPGFRDAGNYTVYVKAYNNNLDDSFASADVKITERPMTITAGSSSRTFNGQPLTNTNYSITNGSLAENDELTEVTVVGSQTAVGSSPNIPSNAVLVSFGEVESTDNYEITYINGTLTVTSAGGGGGTTTRDDDEEINEPLPLAPIQPEPEIEIPVVVEEEPIIIPEEPEMEEFEEPAPLAAPAAPTLPDTGSVGAGEMAGFGALLMAVGILLKKKKGF